MSNKEHEIRIRILRKRKVQSDNDTKIERVRRIVMTQWGGMAEQVFGMLVMIYKEPHSFASAGICDRKYVYSDSIAESILTFHLPTCSLLV